MLMRSFLLTVALFLIVGFSSAQSRQDWGAISQRLDVSKFTGKKFRIEAAIRTERKDSSAFAGMWVRVDDTKGKIDFYANTYDRPIIKSEWALYSITGKIGKTGQWLNLGGIFYGRGQFFYDQFRIFIENEKGEMQEIDMVDPGFESAELKNWYTGLMMPLKGTKVKAGNQNPYQGNLCLMVDSREVSYVASYGSNDSLGKYANVNGVRLYYEEYGKGAPLLLLHGNSENIHSFEKQIGELSKYYRVIAVDTRGHGRSTTDDRRYTYELFAEDMNAFLDQLGLDSVHVVGWSDGGNTGLIMAMKYPKKIKTLVTMGANVFIDRTVVPNSVFKEIKVQLQELENDSTPKGRNRVRLLNLLVTEPNHSFEELKQISCPVLVMAGEKDLIKENHTKSIAANIPKGELHIEPKRSHYFPQEDGPRFNKLVLDFIAKY